MKRLSTVLLLTLFLFSSAIGHVEAATLRESGEPTLTLISESIQVLSNGITVITTIHSDNFTPSITPLATQYTTTKTKTQTFKNGTNILFTFSVNGTFVVNPGVSSTCTASTYSHTIGNTAWSLDSASASKYGATATATGLFKKRLLFIVVDKLETTVTLTCDKNGNFS